MTQPFYHEDTTRTQEYALLCKGGEKTIWYDIFYQKRMIGRL